MVTLRAGDVTLEIAPEVGGSVTRLDQARDGRVLHWLRPTPAEAVAQRNPLAVASFPLVNYSNRIRDGRFPIGGETIQLPIHHPERHALHGDGWTHPWTVEAATATEATLAFDWTQPDRPMRYTARQHYALRPDGLAMTISLTNREDRPMPGGIGFHPWFPLTPGARMTANLPRVWLVDAEYMPLERVDTPPGWDFRRGLRFAGTNIANAFSGWDGTALIDWPELDMRLALAADPALRQIVLYAPDGGDFFCVEPVSNGVDAFNLGAAGVPDVGYTVLPPGGTLSGTATLTFGRIPG